MSTFPVIAIIGDIGEIGTAFYEVYLAYKENR